MISGKTFVLPIITPPAAFSVNPRATFCRSADSSSGKGTDADVSRQAGLFPQLTAAGCERKSAIVTSNLPLSNWGETFSDPVISSAIIDRLPHHPSAIKPMAILIASKDSFPTGCLRPSLLSKLRIFCHFSANFSCRLHRIRQLVPLRCLFPCAPAPEYRDCRQQRDGRLFKWEKACGFLRRPDPCFFIDGSLLSRIQRSLNPRSRSRRCHCNASNR